MESILTLVQNIIWGPPLLILLLLMGLLYSIKSGFFQFFGIRYWLFQPCKTLVKPQKTNKDHIKIHSLLTALAGSIGIGNIAGVATALYMGGPGAVFWMWIAAFLGMMLKYGENYLGVKYRIRCGSEWKGGPMYYLRDGARLPLTASFFSILCILSSLASGNMAQIGSAAGIMEQIFSIPGIVLGVILTILFIPILTGTFSRIEKITSRLVPFMSCIYISGCIAVLLFSFDRIPSAFYLIISDAFSFHSVGTGIGTWEILTAMRYGIARGLFSNEAGMGSSAIVYASAKNATANEQGCWGIFEVFLDTIVGCTLTALCILVTGVLNTGENSGIDLAAKAFSIVMGEFGGGFVAIASLLFGFAAAIGWYYYGEQCVYYLSPKKKYRYFYRFIYLSCISMSTIMDFSGLWNFADITNGLMTIPNLIGLFLLRKTVFHHDQLSSKINNLTELKKRSCHFQ